MFSFFYAHALLAVAIADENKLRLNKAESHVKEHVVKTSLDIFTSVSQQAPCGDTHNICGMPLYGTYTFNTARVPVGETV